MHLQKVKYFILSVIFISLTSCTTTKINEFYNTLAPLIEKREISGATVFADEFYKDCDKYNKLLYSLELGLLYHLNGNYKDSNNIFEQAKSIYAMKDYISTFFNNDTLLPSYYLGEDYEMAYTNFFCALNYLKTRKFKGKRNEAAVEARQLNNLFNKIKIDEINKIYKDDGFLRYFMGIVYQNAGYFNDAIISYKLALTAYGNYNIYTNDIPKDLINNLYTLYYQLSLIEEAKNLKKQYSFATRTDTNDNGNLYIINYNGIAPKRVEQIITLSFDFAWNKYYKTNNIYRNDVIREFNIHEISAAFPVYKRYNNEIKSFKIEVIDDNDNNNKYYSKSYFVVDIATILEKHLQEPNYKAVFYSRINKYVVALNEIDSIRNYYEQKKQEIINNEELSIYVKKRLLKNLDMETVSNIQNIKKSLNTLNTVDLKSWRTLPEKINMAKINLPKGKYTIIIKYLDVNENVVEIKELKTKIRKGKNKFILTNSFKGNY